MDKNTEQQQSKKRSVTIPTKFRAASDGQAPIVSGHAAVFNVLSEPLWEYNGGCEMLAPGCFSDSLATPDDVRLLINHDSNLVLARNTAGTCSITQDDIGLAFEATLGNQSYAQDLAISMERGDITGCSFAFMITDSEMRSIPGQDMPVNVITGAQLSDISIVTFPAYPAATATVRELVFKDGSEPINLELSKKIEPLDIAWLHAARKRQLEILSLKS